MALDWFTVKAEHVRAACDLVMRGENQPRAKAKGIFVLFDGQFLPAKHVLRTAYCIANKLPADSAPKFASGEGTIKVLRDLGFTVERSPNTSATSS